MHRMLFISSLTRDVGKKIWLGLRKKIEEWNSGDRGKEGPVEHEVLENWGLLALQGMCLSFIQIDLQ